MAVNPSTYLSFTMTDFSQEKGVMQINIDPLDATSILLLNASPLPTGKYKTLADAVNVITLGEMAQFGVTQVGRLTNDFPTSAASQREKKWIVSYEDTVTFKKYSVEIPCALETTGWFKANSDEIDLSITGNAWEDFVNAFEAAAVSPDGNPVNVLKVVFSGSRL